MGKVLCVGEMVIDFLPGEEKDSYIRKAGGAPANVAIALSRQGVKASFCGLMGNDDFGRFLMKTLEDNKVTPCITELTDKAITTMAFVSLDESGDRSFTFARKPGADMLLDKSMIRDSFFNGVDVVHAGSCSLSKAPASLATEYALKHAYEDGKLVSFDVNYRDLMWDEDVDAAAEAVYRVLPYVDLLKISDEEACMLGGDGNLERIMSEYDITLIIETLGSKGAVCCFNGNRYYSEGLKANCVDTCGAGDAFWSAFIASLLNSGIRKTDDITPELIDEAMKMGNIAGWLCVQKKGAIESLPTSDEIEKHRGTFYK